LSRKDCRYFTTDNATEKENILAELNDRGAIYFIGDDQTDETVAKAYKNALEFLSNNDLSNPAGDDNEVRTFEQAFSNPTE
jgi:CRISPR-associated protein Cst2